MFNRLFKRSKPKKPPADDPITPESIILYINGRRATIDRCLAAHIGKRDDAIDALMRFPLNYQATEMEIALACKIDYTLLQTIMKPLLNDGSWIVLDAKRRLGKGMQVQRVR